MHDFGGRVSTKCCDKVIEAASKNQVKIILSAQMVFPVHQEGPGAWRNARAVRAVIADPDKRCRQRIRALLKAEPHVEIVEECTQASEIIAALEIHKPDLLVLEPRIPGGNMFELLHSRPPESLPLIIYATSHDQYALKALKTKALDIILKPFDRDRFHAAIERARVELAGRREFLTPRQHHPNSDVKSIPEDRLIVKLGGRTVFLGVGDVDWIEAAANYAEIHAGTEMYRTREPIGRIEKRVIEWGFARIHRSVVVNLAKIKEISCCNSGEYIVRLKNKKELPCSRKYNKAIRALLNKGGT